jgi:hypothetical protein
LGFHAQLGMHIIRLRLKDVDRVCRDHLSV